jgi:hypothetical protein
LTDLSALAVLAVPIAWRSTSRGPSPFAQVTWTTIGSDTVVTVTGPTSSGEIVLAGLNGPLKQSDFYIV